MKNFEGDRSLTPADNEADILSSTSSCCGEQSDFGGDELQNEVDLVHFTSRLTAGIQTFLENEKTRTWPSRYKFKANVAPRTSQRHREKIKQETEALRAAGYGDIRGFWRQRSKSPLPEVISRQRNLSQREEEQETDDEFDQSNRTKVIEKEEEEAEIPGFTGGSIGMEPHIDFVQNDDYFL
ncbi:hypothetical protein M422DRAFT_41986 [Sphaerobolus stellatus SS14]|nr:hypothetical protein M422DRAFT_41986 [Sphaerobolus stellatus SS14]